MTAAARWIVPAVVGSWSWFGWVWSGWLRLGFPWIVRHLFLRVVVYELASCVTSDLESKMIMIGDAFAVPEILVDHKFHSHAFIPIGRVIVAKLELVQLAVTANLVLTVAVFLDYLEVFKASRVVVRLNLARSVAEYQASHKRKQAQHVTHRSVVPL
jgi:hypothetical protein